jgi:MFS family permease
MHAENCLTATSTAEPALHATRLSPKASFYLLGSITVAFLAGSLAPTPLYPIYQAQWGFSALTVSEIFSIYAMSLLGALLVAGRLSDFIGRRPVLIAATLVQALTMALFVAARDQEGCSWRASFKVWRPALRSALSAQA